MAAAMMAAAEIVAAEAGRAVVLVLRPGRT
eukprot:SAG22_NODE_693_length_7872_cov_13.111797_9_plen_30_part_00